MQSTNLDYWRLKVDHGRQTWHYLESQEERQNNPQSDIDRYWLNKKTFAKLLSKPKNALESARNGLLFYQHLQTQDGHFAGEYGGPMFLIPGLVIVMYITKTPFPAGYKAEIARYLVNKAHKEDGGWGIHTEGESTVFGTSLNYVALRLLGYPADHPVCTRARNTLWKLGGSTGVPTWGKFWLSVIGLYEWEGQNPIPPELWILPYLAPVHAGRMWCHTRMVYLPMSYLYSIRYVAPSDDLILSLRQEIYVEDYSEIKWENQRNNVAINELYAPPSSILNFVNGVLNIYEKLPNGFIRKTAVDEALRQIRFEDENTKFLDIGPVNKMMNMLIVYIVDGPDSETFQKHVARVPDFMWMSGEGMMMNGTNGSQLWDTAFAVQAAMEGGLANEPEFKNMIVKSLEFLDDMQIRENIPNATECYRHERKGAWPFSTRDQGYTVSDCTAEGLKSVLLLQKLSFTPKLVGKERLCDAVNVLLTMQNADGGFASYELQRGPEWLELFNPAQVFGKIMVEYSYPECTTAVLLGLGTFRKLYPNHRAEETQKTIDGAIQFILKSQREDGSWYGSWGICFTYAMFFAMESLSSVGQTVKQANMRRACEFLVSKQMPDGGWGESYKSCETGEWHNLPTSQVVQTSWALLALMAAKYENKDVIKRGIQLIMSRQQGNGEWLQENIEGVFNKNCMISYPNYKFAFPIWALSRYSKMYGSE
ncbi:Lanosterol synthase (Oxidosqualene--lanosterol cyclase) [Boothiomyces sp. JEL0866]|nr:Lanosterol synthase (Oxidosqualene--lanosterol cyclase) [Boothiomyces sp. JEL0866]